MLDSLTWLLLNVLPPPVYVVMKPITNPLRSLLNMLFIVAPFFRWIPHHEPLILFPLIELCEEPPVSRSASPILWFRTFCSIGVLCTASRYMLVATCDIVLYA